MVKRIDNSGVVRGMRRSYALMVGALLLGWGALASAQTVTASYQPFPVTVEYQTSSQDVLLTFNSTVILQGVSTNESPDFYVSSDPCVGFVPAGTQCTVTVIFKPYLPGWGSAQAPIGRWAPLQVVYYDFSLSRNVYVNFPLTGTGTHPQAVVTPGTISDLIGNDVTPQAGYAGDGGPASGAQFVTPAAVAMDVMGNIYIADTGNNVVRLYYQQGTFPEIAGPLVAGNVYTIAGIGPTGGVSNGGAGTDGVLATQSALNGPAGVALDAAGNLYISDTNNQAVRMVSATTGIITTIAGTLNANEPPGTGFSGDLGPATAAQLYIPVQIAVDGYGNVFIADAGNDAVRVVYAGGTAIANLIATEIAGTTAVVGDIYTIAGGPTNGPAANNGDAGLAALADLDYPSGVAVDSLGDVFIADSLNNAVRRVDVMSGNISTVYSSGKPVSLSVDASDDIYITLPQSCGVLEYSPTANAGLAIPMSTVVAGDGACAALGDGGSATAASLSGAAGVVADGGGNLYVLEPDGVRLVANASAPLNFGSVNVGSTSPAQSVILTNGDILQSGPSTGTQGTALGLTTGGTPFSIVPYLMANPNILDCDANNYSLSPGQSCGASFTFSPINDGGPFTNFAFSQAGVGVNLTGMGTGPLPTVTLTGGPLSFTAVAKETTSASQPLYLKNTSNITLYMQYPYFTSSYGVFKETDHCGFSSGVQTPTLAPGATCEIDITFSPNAPGPFTGTFNLPDNASTGDGTQTVSLSGTGLAPVGTFSVSEVIITALPGATATEAFNLTNTGTAPLNINPYWVITGNDPARFAVLSSTCGSVLAIGAYCTVTVSFSPLTYAYYSADVSVQDDNGGAPIITQNGVSTFYYNTQTLHMVGETGLPSRTALYYQTNYTFGTVPIGQSATQTVTVELNTSQKLQSIGVMTGFTEFTVGTITGCVIDGVTLNPIGTTCQVPVTFTPQWPGFRTAPMVVTDVEGTVGIPYTFPLTGIGAGSVAAMTPGIISTVVGGANGHAAGIVGADGPAKQAEVSFINGYAIDPIGNQFISDTENEVIWKVDTAGKIHLYAGTPWPYGGYAQGVEGDGGTALGAEIGYAGPLALDSRGGLYLGDNNGNNYGQPTELRYIDSATNSIINFVGFTTPATWSPSTGFGPTNRLQVNVNGTTYLFTAFTGGTTGSSAPSWPTSAGTGVFDGTMEWINQGVYYGRAGCAAQTDSWGDGCPASEATVGTVGGITLDRGGNLFFSDTGYVTSNSGIVTYHSMIRRVDATTKVVTLFAGNGTYGYTGDGGTATSAEVTAGELAFDSKGNLYFSDGGGTILRRVDATTGFISTFAGQEVYSAQQNYCSGGGGDEGPASAATFANLSSLVIDAADDIYLVDGSSCHVRRIDAATGTIHNVAGLPGTYGYYGPGYGDSNQSGSDGDATQAFLNQPGFVRLDGQANMYIASAFGGVRKIDVTQSVLNFTGSASTNNAFSQQAVNTVSAAQTATVLNAGNGGALGFTTPFLAAPAWGISSSNFLRDVTSPTGSADCYTRLSISQGSICPVNVDFGPLSGSGWLTGIDTVNDTPTAGTATQPIALYGNAGGTTPLVTLTPFLLSFSVAQGATSAPQTLTLTNNDVNPLPISSITITGAGSTAFGQVNNCGTSLAAISSCIIEVVFSPPVLPGSGTGGPPPDLLQATVTITDTAGTSPQTAQMTGVGTLPAMGEPGLTPDIEEIHISDTVSLVPSTLLAITETITVSDGMPSTVPSTLLPIYETVHVTDSERGLAGTTPTATTTISWSTPAAITYGTALSATQLDASSTVSGSFAYTPASGTLLTAGTHTLSVTLTPTDTTDYTTATTTVQLTVNQATPTISWSTPSAITYGTALSSTQLDASSTVAGSFAYTPASGTVLTAGTHTLSVTLTPSDTTDYTTSTASVQLTVNKATPTISWSTPSAITYGTPLSATQLDASSTVAGSFAYTPASGTVLTAGTQTLSVTLTPTDTTDYTTATTTVQLTVNQATPAISWTTPSAITYGTALSATQLDASSTVAGSFAYTPASGTVLTAGTHTLSVTFTPTDSTDFTTATATVQLTVNKATPTISWATPAAITYGTALSATQLDASSTVAGTFAYTPASGTVLTAGTQTLSVTLTPTDTADYTTATATVQLTVNQATPTISWSAPLAITYGTALSSTQLDASSTVAGTFVYIPASGSVLTAGSHTLSVTLTPTDTTDYTTATATVQLTVNKATLAVTANNASRTYDTANPAFTDTITGFVNGDTRSAVSGSASLTTTATLTSAVGAYPITAAQGTLSATNYAFSFVNGTLTITQATPTISWSAPSAITYGTALSATQLDASSAVAGSFAYTPASGTVLTAGTHTLSVTLTPTDTTDYTTTTATVQLTVNQVTTPAISWATPSAITYGTALSATQLDASSTVAGTFVYTPASGSVLTAGTHTLSVTFTPSDTTDYTTATTTVQLTVNQAMPTISWSAPSAITYGTALSATQLDASSTVAGTLAYTPASGTVLTAGAHTLSVTLTPTDTTDYTTATTTVQLTVNQATPTISWSTPSAITYGTALSATQLDASSTVAGTLAYTPASGTALTAGSHTLSVTLTPTDTTDYTTATTTVQLTVNQATPAVAIASSANPVLVQNSLTLTATVTSGAGTPTGTVTFLDGSTPLGTGTLADGVATLTTSSLTVGTHSISAAYGGDQNFVTAASSPLTQVVQDFSINVNPSAPAVVTALPGGTVVYTFTATPPTGSTFPANIVLTASGLPAGATYSFSPATIAAGAGSTTVTLTIDLPQTNAAARQVAADPGIQLATNSGGKRSGTSGNVVRRLAPFALALILLPFAGRLRRAGSRLRRTMSLLLFMLAGIGAIAGLGGCGSGTGFFAQPPETYTVTVTATSGALSHSFTFTLTVE